MQQDTAPAPKKIIIAEDEVDLREALVTSLSAAGYHVLSADNGADALKMTLDTRPHLLLLDLMMPKLSGQEVLASLEQDEWGKGLQVVVLTVSGDLHTVSSTLERGVVDYLVKSDFSLADIVEKVQSKIGPARG